MYKTIQNIVKNIVKSYGSQGITWDGLYRQASLVNGDFTHTQFSIAIARIDGTDIIVRGEQVYDKQFVKVEPLDTESV